MQCPPKCPPKQTKKESKFRLYTVGELNHPKKKTSRSEQIADVSYLDIKKQKLLPIY